MSDRVEFGPEWHRLWTHFVREGWNPGSAFSEAQLPTAQQGQRLVYMTSARLAEFRAHYALLLGIVSLLLNRDPETLCADDMVRALVPKLSGEVP